MVYNTDMNEQDRDALIDVLDNLSDAEQELINAAEMAENWTEVLVMLKDALKEIDKAAGRLEYHFNI